MKLRLQLVVYLIVILQLIISAGLVHAQTAKFNDGYFGCNSSTIQVNAPQKPAFGVVGGDSLRPNVVTYKMYQMIYHWPKNGNKWIHYDWMGPATGSINNSVGIYGLGPAWYLDDGTEASTQKYSVSSSGWYLIHIAIYDPETQVYEYHWAKNPTSSNPNNVMCKNF